MSEYDMVDRLEKQIEGSNLALAAVAEVLQKVAGEVYGLIKADQGMDVSPEPATKAVTMGKEMGDKEKAVTIDTKTANVQHAIQAMQKQLNMLKEHGNDEWSEEDKDPEDGDPQDDEEGQEGDSPPKRKDDDDDGGFGMNMYSVENGQEMPALEQMQKQINMLTKAFKGQYDIQKMVQSETEGRLRKMGFREETSLTRPTLLRYEDSLGVDGSTPIAKGNSPDDVVDQMINMSYKDLRVLQEKIESGETEGIPREFIG